MQNDKHSERVDIFTDGGCRGNPGIGGWAALLRRGQRQKAISGAEQHTTNNRMELMAVIKAFECLTRTYEVHITTDSQYVKKGITEWIKRWKLNGWRNSAKQPVKNADLWRRLDDLVGKHTVNWHWVKGHSGHPENTEVDRLANKAMDGITQKACNS